MTQAVILAGGKGKRLAERLNGKPKPLVDVGGIPLLQRQLDALTKQGVDDFVVLVNHAAEQIVSFVGDLPNEGRRIRVIDDGHPRGTAGAVLGCLDELAPRFLVIYGDTLFNIDIERFLDAHRAAEVCGTLFLHPNDHPYDSDLVELDGAGLVRAFHSSPHDPAANRANLVNAALYVLERDSLEPWRGEPGECDFGKHLFPQMLRAGMRLHGYRSFEYIKDIGTPDRLDRAARHLRDGVVDRAFRGAAQQCVFTDRDGTLNELRDYVRSPQELNLIPGVAAAMKTLNQSEYRVAVVTNQPVISRGDITEEELGQIHAKLEAMLGESGAFVDGVYYCPHHPHGGFVGERVELKIDCNCRKPKDGLLRRAAEDLNADLGRSWVIGDSTADIEMARNVGVRSVLVGRGEAGADGKFAARPDFTAGDFGSAVKFICEVYPSLVAALRELLSDILPAQPFLVYGGPAAQIVAKVLLQLIPEAVTVASPHGNNEGTLVLQPPRGGNRQIGVPGDMLSSGMDAVLVADEVQRPDWGSAKAAIRILVKQSTESHSAWLQLGYCQAEPVRDHYRSGEIQDGDRIVFDLDDIPQLSEVAR